MDLKPLWMPVLLYTGLFSILTVGAVYLATHSGVYILVLAGAGVLFVALGGGAAGRVGTTDHVEDAGMEWEDTDASSPSPMSPLQAETSPRVVLLFYGLGLCLWSLVVLGTLRETLV
jgi:hypothetical protein